MMAKNRTQTVLQSLATLLVLIILSLPIPCLAQTAPTPTAPVAPAIYSPGPDYAFDSGWIHIAPGQPVYLTHNLGGSIDDYVVDLRFTSDDDLIYFHHHGFGGTNGGTYWSNLSTSSIKITSLEASERASYRFRVRIWLDSNANYDSGWVTTGKGVEISRTHGLGGSADDYLVYMEFKDLSLPGMGINQAGYGGTTNSASTSGERIGAYWKNLTTSTIKWVRQEEDDAAHQVRVRIWKAPRPTFDSGWSDFGGAEAKYAFGWHSIGGRVDDYIIDLQFKDTAVNSGTNEGHGVNQRCYGGCFFNSQDPDWPGTNQGASWMDLDSKSWSARGSVDDRFADQVRIRIWNTWKPPRPNYDSGWKTATAGDAQVLTHNLGGSADDYLVDLSFKSGGVMTNQLFYGGKTFGANPPSGYSENDGAGAYWKNLTSSSISVQRMPDDLVASQFRARIWKMPKPDYDSGWDSLSPGDSTTRRT